MKRALHIRGSINLIELRKMCDTINDEIGRLADSLSLRHGCSTAAVATLLYVTSCVFSHYGEAHGVDLASLLAVQRRCVDAFLLSEGVGQGAADAALLDLRRANDTVAYLSSIPA